MEKKIAYAVFTITESGLDYMVKGNFGSNQEAAEKWRDDNQGSDKYPNGLFVKKLEY